MSFVSCRPLLSLKRPLWKGYLSWLTYSMLIVKGKRAVQEALHSDQEIDRILVVFSENKRPDIQKLLSQAKQRAIKVQRVPETSFQNLEIDHHQGIIAYIKAKAEIIYCN